MTAISNRFFEQMVLRRHNQVDLLGSYIQAIETSGLNIKSSTLLSEINSVALALIEEINAWENESKRLNKLPAYHNPQHFSDCMLAMGFFVQNLSRLTDEERLLLILTMMVHDFGHNGKALSPDDISHEQNTINLLQNTAFANLTAQNQHRIFECILGTQPSVVKLNHQNYVGDPSNKLYLRLSLVNDSDIAASCIPELTNELSELILVESGNLSPNEHEVAALVSWFRANYQLTTDIAKQFYASPH